MDVSNRESVYKALKGKYFDVVFDNLAYCSNYVDNVLNAISCGRYIQLSSVEAYKDKKIDLREEDFDPKTNPMKLVDTTAGYVVGKDKRKEYCIKNIIILMVLQLGFHMLRKQIDYIIIANIL